MSGAQRRESYEQVVHWLGTSPSLDELTTRYPDDWGVVRVRIAEASERGTEGLHALIAEFAVQPKVGRDRQLPQEIRASQLIRRRMLQVSLTSISDRAESGVRDGPIRFRRLDGLLLQSTLFANDLVRKPVNLTRFRIVWRLARQRDRLMPLVRAQGIYCFYSRPLLRALAGIIDGRAAIEIAAGDGTLSRFLSDEGVKIQASDDHSWTDQISYPGLVEKLDARSALKKHAPSVVICSWPPSRNSFERAVFSTPSVDTYIVITSWDEREAGDAEAYRSQAGFDLVERADLSAAVLPTGRNRVLVFSRR